MQESDHILNLTKAMRLLEKKVDMIMSHLNLEFNDTDEIKDTPETDEIKRLVFIGKKLEAMKLFMNHFGVGLKEAKEAIDKLNEALKK